MTTSRLCCIIGINYHVNKKFINLTEHQSTLSPNMPLRFLEYIAREYRKLYFSRAVYSETPVKLPTPEFYVLYNGTKDAPLEQTLKLSDTFVGECDTMSLELIVKVINVNYEKGSEILERCGTLKEYSLFIHRVRELLKECRDLDVAVEEAVRECISEGILAEFLRENGGDVMSFVELWLTQEECEAIREEDGYIRGHADGLREGHADGLREKAIETAGKMKAKGYDVQSIAEMTGLRLEEIGKL